MTMKYLVLATALVVISHPVFAQSIGPLSGDAMKCVALTFDDGPKPQTPALLAALKEYGLHATFFLIGENVEMYPNIARQIVAEGHHVEAHTFTHPDLTDPLVDVLAEITHSAETIWQVTHQNVQFLRPPYGKTDDHVSASIDAAGLYEVLWNVDSNDWQGWSVDEILAAFEPLAENPGIVLMHDHGAHTIEAIPRIAAFMVKNGLCVGRLKPSERVFAPNVGWFGAAVVPW